MNKKQKLLLRLCGAALCAILAFPPYWVSVPTDLYDSPTYAPIWSPPTLGAHAEQQGVQITLATGLLGFEILVVCIIGACGLIPLMDAPKVSKNLFHR